MTGTLISGRVRALFKFVAACALASCGLIVFAQSSSDTKSVFPLSKGTYWVYEGNVTYQLTPNQTVTSTIRRRMQVADVINGAEFRAALIQGGPWDLEFYSTDKPAGDYLIVATNEATYLAQGEQARDLFAEIRKSGLTHEIRDTLAEDIWFRIPLRANGTYCAPDQLARDDRMYCWAVMAAKPERVAVTGVKSGTRTVYELAFRTNPDHQIVQIAPGIGMLHFTYAHHGTPSEADVKLVDFHAGT